MNYSLIRRNGVPVAMCTSVDVQPMVALHEPKTASYFDDKDMQRVTQEEFYQHHPEQPAGAEIKITCQQWCTLTDIIRAGPMKMNRWESVLGMEKLGLVRWIEKSNWIEATEAGIAYMKDRPCPKGWDTIPGQVEEETKPNN